MISHILRRAALIAGVLLTVPAAAATETPVEEAKAQARTQSEQAAEKYDSGDYAAALELFSSAYSSYPAPTIGLFVARSLAALRRFVEAIQTYDRVIASRAAGEQEPESGTFRQAHEDAVTERAQLIQKVATVTVAVEGPRNWNILIDGKPPVLNEAAFPIVDPGEHTILVQSEGYETGSRRIEVQAGEQMSIHLSLQLVLPPPSTPVAAHTPLEAAQKVPPPPEEAQPPRHPSEAMKWANEPPQSESRSATSLRPLRTMGYISVGVGVSALALGTFAALDAASKKRELDADCVATRCASSAESTLDKARSSATIATWATLIGAGLVATGITLVIIGSSDGSGKAKSIVVSVAPGSIGVNHAF